METLFSGFAAVFIIIVVFALLASAFWLWMLVDALVNERDPNQKLLWFLVIFFLHFIGAIIYFVVRRAGRMRGSSVV
jgi:hypothetical protein